MKLLVCLALLGLSLAALQPLPIRSQLRFRYDGIVLSGLPISQTDASITRIQSEVTVQTIDDRTALLRLDSVRLAASLSATAQSEMPFESLEKRELAEEHQRILSLPVRFNYKHGMVSELQFHEEELAWSANIKRAVINMLQINLNKVGLEENVMESQEMVTKANDFFTVVEKTIEGDCQVAYTINKDSEDKTTVSKSVNFDKCTRRADVRYNLRFASECPECEDERVVVPQSVYTYTMERDLLKQVEVISTYTVMIKEQPAMKTQMRARLELIETTELSRHVMEVPRTEKQELIYSNEWERNVDLFFKNGDKIENMPFAEFTNKLEQATKIVRELTQLKEHEPESVHLLARLVRVFRMSSMSELKQFHTEVYRDMDLTQKDIVHHALAICGTKNTVEHLLRHMEHITVIKAAQLFKSIQETPYPSEHIATLLAEFARSELCLREPVIRQSVWLAFGAVVRGTVVPTAEIHLYKENSVEIKNKFVRIIKDLYNKAETTYEKILAVKTFANAAIDISVVELEKIILNKKEHISVCIEAIDALRLFSEQMPRKVQRVLMPVFSSRFEQPELRMAALVQLLHSQPRMPLLSQVVVRMERESNMQIAAFTYRLLSSVSESTSPCMRLVASDISLLLKQTTFRPEQRYMSAYFHLPVYTQKWMSGFNFNLASIFGKDSVIPKELMVSLDTVFAGNWNKYFAQVGFSQQNIEQLFNKIAYKLNRLEKQEGDVVRGRRVQNSLLVLKELARKMNIRVRFTSRVEPNAMIYLRYKQMDYAVLPIDETIVDTLIEKYIVNGKLDQQLIERVFRMEPRFSFNHAAFFFETSQKLPTILGLPLTVSAKLPTLFSAQGELSFDKISYGLRTRLTALPTLASTHVYQMRIWTPIFEHGVKLIRSLRSTAPIAVDVEFQLKNKFEINVRFETPSEEKNLLRLSAHPVAFLRFPENLRYVEAEQKTIALPHWDKMTRDLTYDVNVAGIKMMLRGNDYHQWTLENILLGEQNIEIIAKPTHRTPKEVSARLVIDMIKIVPTIEEPMVEKMFEREFDLEETEWESRDEKLRREHVRKTVRNMPAAWNHRMQLTIVAEKKSEIELLSECDALFTFFRTLIKARIPTEERNDWTLESRVEVVLPETVSTLKQLKESIHREMQVLIESKWGVEETNEMSIKMQLEQSREQRQWARLAEKELRGIPAYEMLVEAARLNQLNAVVEYKLSPSAQNYFARFFDWFKIYNFWSTRVEMNSAEPRRIHLLLKADPTLRHLTNLTVQTPREKIVVRDMQLPIYLPTIARMPFNVLETSVWTKAECRVNSKNIRTFDDVIFRAPLTTCYSVVAKDCSEEPRFAVLVKNVAKRGEEKKVKIMNNNYVYEMVLVNGEMKITRDGRVLTIGEYMNNNIEMISENMILINLKDVIVRFDGYTVKVQMEKKYMNTQCGLCGHFDGEKKVEFRTANDESTEDIENFHRSFLVKHEECEMEETKLAEKKNYRLESSEEELEISEYEPEMYVKKINKMDKFYSAEESDYVSEDRELVKKTRVVEFSHRVCFSVEPIMECPKETKPAKVVEKKIRFTCLARHQPEARRLLTQARSQPLYLNELPISFVDNLLVPQTCTVY